MPVMDVVFQKMSEARDYISDRTHWTKGTLTDGKQRYCSIGVINKVAERGGARDTLMNYVSRAIRLLAQEGKLASQNFSGEIADFNDHGHTKHEHVVMVFDKAKELIAAEMPQPAQTETAPEPGVYIQMPAKVAEKVG